MIKNIQENRILKFGKSAYDEANLSYTSIRTRSVLEEDISRGGRQRGMREAEEIAMEVSQNTEPVP